MIAGVASGIGRYCNVDPTLIRVIFAVTVLFTGGIAVLAYPIMWFLIPAEPVGTPAWPHPATPGPTTTAQAWPHPAAPGPTTTAPTWPGPGPQPPATPAR